LIEIINKQLLLQLVGYLCYWQMGFNSVFKGLITVRQRQPKERGVQEKFTFWQELIFVYGKYLCEMCVKQSFCLT